MKLTIRQFLKEQLFAVPSVVTADLHGKTVIVTGANNGIGFEAAKHFARMNPAKLIMACRSKGRGEAALAKLREETGCKTAEVWLVDLAEFKSVKAFAERFEQEGGRLDILVENAGITEDATFKPTVDGWEPTFQVNNLSTSLLALLLLPRMIETAEKHKTTPRLVVVASEVHFWAKFDKEMLEAPNPLQLFGRSPEYVPKVLSSRYFDTKLLNVLFARGLNERLKSNSVIINTVNPGFCYSGIRRNFSGFRKIVDWLMEKALARTAEAGSRQLVWAAIGGEDKLDALRGAYVSLAQISEASNYVIGEQGKKDSDKLWDNLVDELTKVEPKVQQVVSQYLKA